MTNPIFVNLSHYGFLKIAGPDAKKLLQGQLTCDLENITSNQCLAAHCNPQGRIISLFRLFIIEDTYYLCMPRNMVAIALAALKKYAVFYRVLIIDASEELFCIGTTFLVDNKNFHSFKIHSSCYLLIGNKNNLENTLVELSQQSKPQAFDLWKTLQFEIGIADIYPETTEKFLPHELNLQELDAISFSKGCYTGQEIIARMHYRGKLKKRMYLVNVMSESLPQPGSEIYCADTAIVCGTVVDRCHEKDNNYNVLLLLNESNAMKNLTLDVKNTHTFTISKEN